MNINLRSVFFKDYESFSFIGMQILLETLNKQYLFKVLLLHYYLLITVSFPIHMENNNLFLLQNSSLTYIFK